MATRKTKAGKKVEAKSLSAEIMPTYDALVSAIESLVLDARVGLKAAMNAIMLQTYWRTGEYIVEYEQNGSDRAIYGSGLMRRLARDLTLKLGRGFSHANLIYMRKLYVVSQKSQTSDFFGKGQTSGFLTWSGVNTVPVLQSKAGAWIDEFVEASDKPGFNMTNYPGADAIKVVTWYNSLTAA